MMPAWLPSFDNGMVAGLLSFACLLAGLYFRAMLPAWRNLTEARARKTDKEAELVGTLPIVLSQQTDLMDRSVAMLNDHGKTLGHHGEKLDEHSHLLREIQRQTARDCVAAVHRAEDRP